MLDHEEFDRWYISALTTMESAKRDLSHGDYNWACFKVHQAVEKGLKALLWGIGKPKTAHSLRALAEYLRDSGFEVDDDIFNACVELSKYYTPTRYPDLWSEGIPEDYYTENEAKNAVKQGEIILRWVREIWKKLSGRE